MGDFGKAASHSRRKSLLVSSFLNSATQLIALSCWVYFGLSLQHHHLDFAAGPKPIIILQSRADN
jgi:hypothetical protein